MATYLNNNFKMDSEAEFHTSHQQENKNTVNPPAFKRTALATLQSNNTRCVPFREVKAREPLSNIGQIIDVNVIPGNKQRVTVPSKPPVFEIYQDEQGDKENASRFKVQDSSVFQKVLPSKMAFVPWSTNVDNKKESVEECKEKFPVEEECDTSVISLPDNVVQLYKYEVEDKENHASPMILDDSLNESQDLIKQAWMARKNLYDYAEYSKDVYEYLREAEVKHQPKPNYMRKQADISLDMRSILVDWLVEVGEEYKLQNETLYLSVSLIDRFLSLMTVLRSKLQLVGTTSMFIAAKYEEIYPPEIKEFVYITDETYSKGQVLRMEHLILRALTFNINVPTIYCFLQYICCTANLPKTVLFLAQYLCELTLLEAEPFLQFLPSQIAAAAVSLSNYTMGYEAWDAELEQTTGYKLQDLSNVIDCLYVAYRNSSHNPRQAIKQKYKATVYHGVSSIPPPEELMSF